MKSPDSKSGLAGNAEYSRQVEHDMQSDQLRRYKKDLDDSLSRYTDLYEQAPVGYCTLSKEGLILEANLTLASLVGVSRDSLIGQPLSHSILAEDQDIYHRYHKQLFETEGSQILELRMLRKDGSPFLVRLEAEIARNDSSACRAIISDITAHVQKEAVSYVAAIREGGENEGRYRRITEALTDYIFTVKLRDGQPVETIHGPGCLAVTGYTPEEFIADPFLWWRMVVPEDRQAVGAQAQSIIEGGEFPVLVHRIMHKNGEVRWVRNTPVPHRDEKGFLLAYDGLIQDITEHKLAQEALAESEEKFRTILENIEDGYFEVDLAGNFVFTNESLARILGYQRDELPGMNNREYMDTENARKVFETFNKVYLTGKATKTFDWKLIRKDGSECFIETSISLKRDRDGKPTGFHGITRDITERKLAGEIIKLNETRLESLLRINQYPANTIDDLLRYALAEAIDLTGSTVGYVFSYDKENDGFVLTTWSKDIKEQCSVANSELLFQLENTGLWGEPIRQRRPIIINDFAAPNPLKRGLPEGHVPLHKFLTIPVIVEDDIVAVVGVANKEDDYNDSDIRQMNLLMDSVWKIVQRKKAEEELALEKNLVEAIFNSIPGLLYLYDSEYKLVRWNKKHETMTGYSSDELASMKMTDWFGGDQKSWEAIVKGVEMTQKTGFGEAEANFRKKDGTTIPMYFTGSLLTINGKKYLTGIGIDISERRQAEERQERLQAQLNQSQKMESVGRLAGGVAHDFNNMLGIILGHTELALEKFKTLGQPLIPHLLEIRKAAERSADLTRQLLAFARKQIVTPLVLDLNETVEGMLTMLKRLIGEDIQLTWIPGMDLWPVKIDPSQVDQILANCCVNARDAIDGIGKITVETKNITLDHEFCVSHVGFIPGDYIVLVVSDNGCGMDRETLKNLFEPFFTTKAVGKGTGLGTAMVYGIVKQNKGFINVYSEPGQGTSFTIYLPRHQGSSKESLPGEVPPPAKGGNETILLVEDEQEILELTTTMLEYQGYTVLAAATPGEAIELAGKSSSHIDLLMTDVIMPEMNGRDLARELLLLYPDLKRLFMSGYTADIIANHGVLEKNVSFIQKPFSMQDLAIKVREALKK